MTAGDSQRRILLLGLPRSGTTWVCGLMGTAKCARVVHEPDNEKEHPLALNHKRGLHRFPCFSDSEAVSSEYFRIFDVAFNRREWRALSWRARQRLAHSKSWLESAIGERAGFVYVDDSMNRVSVSEQRAPDSIARLLGRLAWIGSRPAGETRIVKSVHGILAADEIASRWPMKVVHVLRNPFSLFASYRRLKMPDGFRNLFAEDSVKSLVERLGVTPAKGGCVEEGMIEQIMLLTKVSLEQIKRHPDWYAVSHDRLCLSPGSEFRRLFEAASLEWTSESDERLQSSNRPGSGFSTDRVTADQPFVWRKELGRKEVSALQSAIDRWQLGDDLARMVLPEAFYDKSEELARA